MDDRADVHEWGSDELRAAWVARTHRIGDAAVSHLEALCDEVDDIIVTAVSTGDGFNLCAIGLDEDDIGRFAALGSSLNSVAQTTMGSLPGVPRKIHLDVASALAGDLILLSVTFDHPTLGSCILTAVARDVSLGRLKLEVMKTAETLKDALRDL